MRGRRRKLCLHKHLLDPAKALIEGRVERREVFEWDAVREDAKNQPNVSLTIQERTRKEQKKHAQSRIDRPLLNHLEDLLPILVHRRLPVPNQSGRVNVDEPMGSKKGTEEKRKTRTLSPSPSAPQY
jgi:hypothetical protein